MLRHQWLPEVMYTRPSIGPNAISLGSRGIRLFGAAGFTGRDVDYAMGSVMSYVLGTVNAEVSLHSTVRKAGQSIKEWAGDVFAQAQSVAADSPEMQESLRRRVNRDVGTMHTESFVFGLDALLDGLEARLKK